MLLFINDNTCVNPSCQILLFCILQHWKDVSPLAKDFIDKLLVMDPNERLGAAQSLKVAIL